MSLSTGDLHNISEKLKSELKSIKYPNTITTRE